MVHAPAPVAPATAATGSPPPAQAAPAPADAAATPSPPASSSSPAPATSQSSGSNAGATGGASSNLRHVERLWGHGLEYPQAVQLEGQARVRRDGLDAELSRPPSASTSVATYLNSKLRPKGELLSGYRTLAGSSLPDYLAMISGQAPNPDTLAGCPDYADFAPGVTPAKDGQTPGSGCVYPNTALTIGDQMDGADLRWRAYIGSMTSPCEHPNSGAATVPPSAADPYSPTVNPFVYFHSLLDLGDCQSDDQPLAGLKPALRSAGRTPSYVFIAADPCQAGLSASCPTGQPSGLAAVDSFLQATVPMILHAPAYRHGGALMILFTVAPPAAGAPPSPATDDQPRRPRQPARPRRPARPRHQRDHDDQRHHDHERDHDNHANHRDRRARFTDSSHRQRPGPHRRADHLALHAPGQSRSLGLRPRFRPALGRGRIRADRPGRRPAGPRI